MNVPRVRHSWNLTPTEAVELQRQLAGEILQCPLVAEPKTVAGGDAAFIDDGTKIVAGWIVWERKKNEIIEQVYAVQPVRFPYVPGLLSFREAPALIAAARKLKAEPDLFMYDGQGYSHPRRIGIASHVGLLLDRPTIGCAKTRLCGTHDTPADAVGASKPLLDDGERIGRVVRTQRGVKPLYISVGHRITLEEAVRQVLRSCTRFRLPEPTRLADQYVTRLRGELGG